MTSRADGRPMMPLRATFQTVTFEMRPFQLQSTPICVAP